VWKDTATKANRRRDLLWALAFVLVVLASSLGAYLYGRSQSPADLGERDRDSLSLYAQALDRVREDYVDQEAVDARKQTYGAIEGMLESLGDEGHTRFLTPEEVEENEQSYSGTYIGVGIQLREEGEEIVVSELIEDSPAQRAGIEPGDVLVAVDGESVRGKDVAEVTQRVQGPEGSMVELTFLRDGEEREFSMRRAELVDPSVSWILIPDTDTAHVGLERFAKNSAEELATAFEEARAAGAERFILDLRNNPGGQVDQAVAMAEDFLEPESVVYVREDASGEREEIRVPDGAEPTDAPMVVLVNGGSASSAEILAGALRDNDRAPLVGTTTFGTGTVLKKYTLRDGSAILLGVAEWLTPDGDFIRGTGIEPDVEAKLPQEDEVVVPADAKELSREEIFERDSQLERAFEVLQRE
jgi:carboxyl-terminal processing protease